MDATGGELSAPEVEGDRESETLPCSPKVKVSDASSPLVLALP